MKYYAGIGSRKTPTHILSLMSSIARRLETKGYILRSGSAAGADKAFMRGTSGPPAYETWDPRTGPVKMHNWAIKEISKYCKEFPFAKMQSFTKQLLVRNMYQILGENGDKPVKTVICWTPTLDPCHKDAGGTRYACRCAIAHNIPVWNLNNPVHKEKIEIWLQANN